MAHGAEVTPLMRQYLDIKKQFQDTLLFFQVGDFYELFFDDAKVAAACLGIALTKRGNHKGEPIPLCGVPVHALEHYLHKLIKAGHKVALCDQLEEPKPGKVVDRGITQVFTPGTLTNTKLLDEKSASYLFSLYPGHTSWGLLFGELLTAQLHATIIPPDNHRSLEAELTRFFPDEILVPAYKEADQVVTLCKRLGYFVTRVHDAPELRDPYSSWVSRKFTQDIQRQLGVHESLQQSLFYLYRYLTYANADALEHITSIHLYQSHDYLVLDRATQVNLELIANSRDGSTKHSLFATLDAACTPMGSRLIKKWIMRPLVQKKSIEQRLDAVELLHKAFQVQREIQRVLKEVGDIERVIGRIALGRAPLHDYLMLMRTLALVPSLQQLLTAASSNPLLAQLITFLGNFHTIHALLDASLNTDSAQDFIIKKGFDQRLDHIRELVHCAHEKISTLELEEQQNTRINSLKIGYNGVQGYYIEITKANQNAVPRHYVRLQTLAGRERYMIPALQQLQQEIMHAKAEIQSVEKTVFDGIKREIVLLISPLRKMAHALAHIDALTSFALISYDHNYVRPTFNEARDITILQGRHPIVERVLSHQFIANDTLLTDEQSTWIITGPNMGGKSTYLRQVACMSIMAQIGCFVPAQVACLPLVDRIFTRIGAGDQLALGKSTFLVEMEETATICHQATAHSLVILDEVGRGTSTFDGLAIAQAVVEYLHTQVRARCLFATHYHELSALREKFQGIESYYAASRKTNDGILFLYTIIKGVADGSFGVEVAKIAELPAPIIERAQELLKELTCHAPNAALFIPAQPVLQVQQEIEQLRKHIQHLETMVRMIQELNMETISSRQALDLLWQLKESLNISKQ